MRNVELEHLELRRRRRQRRRTRRKTAAISALGRPTIYYVEVGVKTSTALPVLDLRVSTAPLIELALVLGRELLCGDCPSPMTRGGVGAAEVSIGVGIDKLCGIIGSAEVEGW